MRDFERELPAFIGGKSDYYMRNYEKLKTGGISWNWCSFFFAGFWMLYRRMYLFFFIFIGIAVVVNGVLGSALNTYIHPSFSTITSIAIWVLMGMFGNKIYFIHIERKFKASNSYEDFIKKGGTSIVGPAIFTVIFLCLSVTATMLDM